MTIIFIFFFVFATIFTKRSVDNVKDSVYQSNALKFFQDEKKKMKIVIILAIIASIAILIFKKDIVVFALAVLHIVSVVSLVLLIKNSNDSIDGKNERFAVRLFTAEKLMIICTLVYGLANLVC